MVCYTYIGCFSVDKILGMDILITVPSIIYAYSRDYTWAILSFLTNITIQGCKNHFSIKPNGLSYMFEGDVFQWLSMVVKGTVKYCDL